MKCEQDRKDAVAMYKQDKRRLLSILIKIEKTLNASSSTTTAATKSTTT